MVQTLSVVLSITLIIFQNLLNPPNVRWKEIAGNTLKTTDVYIHFGHSKISVAYHSVVFRMQPTNPDLVTA